MPHAPCSLALDAWISASTASPTASIAPRNWLLGQQDPDGFWCGELEADVMLEADYIFLHTLLGTGDPGKMERAVNEILRHQNEDGGWSLFPGGPSNISYGVKAYFALKLMGWSAEHPVLVKARTWVLAHGGVVECNTFTKIYLCALGQYDYDAVPAIPPEIILFPNWFYFNIYEISSWSRGILVPLSIIYAKKPFKKLAPEQGSTSSSSVAAPTPISTCAATASSSSAGATSSSSATAWRTGSSASTSARSARSPSAKPKPGCSSASKSPTASAPSTPPCSTPSSPSASSAARSTTRR